MKVLVPAFQAHLDGEVTTLCNCWQIHRKDGAIMGFTDHDRDIVFDGITHEAATGLEASDTETSSGLTPDNHEIAGALSSATITEADIAARLYDDARVIHYAVNWSAPEERVRMHTYLISEITREDGAFRAELKSIAALLDQIRTRRFERHCSARLGDGDCGVDLEAGLTDEGMVAEIVSDTIWHVGGLPGRAEDWYAGGVVTVQDETGQKLQIVSDRLLGNGNRAFEFWSAPARPVLPSSDFSATPGCDKLFSTCRQKFANGVNFRGFPHMPTAEFISSYASNATNMDGGLLFE